MLEFKGPFDIVLIGVCPALLFVAAWHVSLITTNMSVGLILIYRSVHWHLVSNQLSFRSRDKTSSGKCSDNSVQPGSIHVCRTVCVHVCVLYFCFLCVSVCVCDVLDNISCLLDSTVALSGNVNSVRANVITSGRVTIQTFIYKVSV